MLQNTTILTSILQNSHIIFFALDRDYKYIQFSKKHFEIMRHIWGKNIKIGDCMLDFISHIEDKNKAKENFDKVLNGETLNIVENYGDHEIFRTSWNNHYFPIVQNNKIDAIGVMVEDLSLQKLQQKRIEEIEMFQNIINLASNGISIADPNDHLKTMFINKAFEKITGYSENEVIGRNLKFLQNEDTNQPNIQIIKDAIKEKRSCITEIRNYKKMVRCFIIF
jgi:PAS domain-containing protein